MKIQLISAVVYLVVGLVVFTIACHESDRLTMQSTTITHCTIAKDAESPEIVEMDAQEIDACPQTFCPACPVCPGAGDGGEHPPIPRVYGVDIIGILFDVNSQAKCWYTWSYDKNAIDALCEDCLMAGSHCQDFGFDLDVQVAFPGTPACATDDSWCPSR